MNTDALIAKAKQIAQDHRQSMKELDMQDSDVDIMRSDLEGQLKTEYPEISDQDMQQFYDALNQKKYVKLISNDIVTFDKDFLR